MLNKLKYPTTEEIKNASQYQLGYWLRFLESPGMSDLGNEQTLEKEQSLGLYMIERFKGWTPELSKQVGWKK